MSVIPRLIPTRRHARVLLGATGAAFAASTLALVPAIGGDLERAPGPNYQQAMRFSAGNLRPFVYDTEVVPHWIGKTDSFWYAYRTSNGTGYYKVNANLASKEPLFDPYKLGTQLAALVQKPLEPTALPLTRLALNDEGTKLKFVVDDFQYEYDLSAATLAKLGKAPPEPVGPRGPNGQIRRDTQRDEGQSLIQNVVVQNQNQNQNQTEGQNQNQTQNQAQTGGGPGGRGGRDFRNYSPDRKNFVYAKNFNLYFADASKEEAATALTTDGVEDYGFGFGAFGGNGNGNGRNGTTGTGTGTGTTGTTTGTTGTGTGTGTATATPPPPDPNAKVRVPATWSNDSKAFYITRSDARGVKDLFVINSLAEPRPTLEKYKYPLPGEEETRRTELYVFDRESKKLTKVERKWKDESYTNVHWGKAPGELRFVRRDRLVRHVELCSLDVKTGKAKTLISEGFENANVTLQPVRYLEDTDEMIWWSERSGWGHFYLYGRDGSLKNAITSGPFRASAVVDVDSKNRLLYFVANAREPGENIYLEHLYSVHFDGTNLSLMNPGEANHKSSLSPSRQFVVDNSSRVDSAPVSVLRKADGKVLLTLETADLSRLKESGWKMPETFVVKAADGVTDLYGNMWKPFDFDAKKAYPIIVHVYPGPQQEGTTHAFSALSGEQQLAQLGFVVIQVGHRGGAPTRSKAYHSYGYFNLRDYGLADKKTAVEQLASRYPFIDANRVGIYGHSGGGFMTAAAMMQKPYNEFFKVGVATSGNHDNNIYGAYWAETYHGLKEIESGSGSGTKSSEETEKAGETRARRRDLTALEESEDDMRQAAEDGDLVSTIGADAEAERPGDEPQRDVEKQDGDKKVDDAKADDKKVEAKVDDKKADDKKVEAKADDKKADDKKVEAKADDKKVEAKVDDKKADEKKTNDKAGDDKKTEVDAKEKDKAAEKKTKFEIHVPTNAELAQNLKGRLLLVHGELDNNVHPANTLRLVDALIKANKRFDMLYLPGKRHAYAEYQPYINQRMMEYFAENLLGDYQTGADIEEKTVPGSRK